MSPAEEKIREKFWEGCEKTLLERGILQPAVQSNKMGGLIHAQNHVSGVPTDSGGNASLAANDLLGARPSHRGRGCARPAHSRTSARGRRAPVAPPKSASPRHHVWNADPP